MDAPRGSKKRELQKAAEKARRRATRKDKQKARIRAMRKVKQKARVTARRKAKGKDKYKEDKDKEDRRSAFSAYLFQIFGNKHMVLAMIRCPCTCAAQLRHFIAEWRKYQETDECKKAVRDSCPKTEEQAARKEDARQLRRQLRNAERYGSENVSELQQLVAEADAAYGFNSNTVDKIGRAHV